jgi:hypothetical protein
MRQVAVRDLAHLDRHPAGDDRLARPLERLVHVSGFQYRKTANVLLGFQIRAVGDEHFAIGLRPHRLRLAGCAEAASDKPGASSFQLVVEHVDLVYRLFALCGRVEVVGEVTRNQIMRHDFSFYPVSVFGRAGLTCLHYVDEWPDPNSTKVQGFLSQAMNIARFSFLDSNSCSRTLSVIAACALQLFTSSTVRIEPSYEGRRLRERYSVII